MRMTKKQIEMYDWLMENTVGFDDLNENCQLYIIEHLLSGKKFNGNLMEFFDLPDDEEE